MIAQLVCLCKGILWCPLPQKYYVVYDLLWIGILGKYKEDMEKIDLVLIYNPFIVL